MKLNKKIILFMVVAIIICLAIFITINIKNKMDYGIHNIVMDTTAKDLEYYNTESIAHSSYLGVYNNLVYFINETDDNKIYKMNLDGSKCMKVADYWVNNLYVNDGWIYFSCSMEGLCKIRIDGSEFAKITEDEPNNFVVSDGWIYYVANNHMSYTNCLYKMSTDGSSKQKLCDEQAADLFLEGDNIYFVEIIVDMNDLKNVDSNLNSNNSKIFLMKTDGSNKYEFKNHSNGGINFKDDWVYFGNGDGIYKTQLNNGKEDTVKLSDMKPDLIELSKDSVFFTTRNGKMKNDLYRMDLDGNNAKKICRDDLILELDFVGDWIFYHTLQPDRMKVMKSDGSLMQLFMAQ